MYFSRESVMKYKSHQSASNKHREAVMINIIATIDISGKIVCGICCRVNQKIYVLGDALGRKLT